MDLDCLDVADDQERRVAKVLVVLEELLVCLVEILAGAFVLPGEVSLIPDVGPAPTSGRLGCPLLERVRLAGGVYLGRRWLTQKAAEVDEVLLGARSASSLPFHFATNSWGVMTVTIQDAFFSHQVAPICTPAPVARPAGPPQCSTSH